MTYVMSDIHGEIEMFHRMLEKINFKESDELYILGDVIDRHPAGVEILLEIMETPNMHMILGNHEQMLLDVLGPDPEICARKLWQSNGGSVTYRNLVYGRHKESRGKIIRFLSSLPDHIELEVAGQKFYLVHGMPGDDHETRIWGRPTDCLNWRGNPKIVYVIGHTPTPFLTGDCDEPWKVVWYGGNMVDIDCGCGNDHPNRRLACMCLDDVSVCYVKAGGE